MQHQLDIATRWCHDSGLVINASKTKLMRIKPPHIRYANIEINYHSLQCLHENNLKDFNYDEDQCSTIIETVNRLKYLGIHIDQNFKWKYHICRLNQKKTIEQQRIWGSNRSNYSVMRQAYFAMVESHIRHGTPAWGNSPHINTLQ